MTCCECNQFQGGIELAVRVLSETDLRLQLLCSATIANLAKLPKVRRLVRRHGGIPRLVGLLDVEHIKSRKYDMDVDGSKVRILYKTKTRKR